MAFLQNLIDNDHQNIKVINFGCNGHTILHEVNFIKKYGLKLSPDYVLVATSLNTDFSDIVELEYNLGYMPVPGYNFVKFCIETNARLKDTSDNIVLRRVFRFAVVGLASTHIGFHLKKGQFKWIGNFIIAVYPHCLLPDFRG